MKEVLVDLGVNAALFPSEAGGTDMPEPMALTGIEINRNHLIVRKFTLFGNYPNPFNNSTVFQFKLVTRGLVRLKIYDMLGREIEQVLDKTLSPDMYKIKWKAGSYPSGIYFYSLSVDDEIENRKLVLTK